MKRIHADRQNIQEVRDEALSLMHDAGFTIREPIKVIIDKDLPFMGYTTQKDDGQVIVVSGRALESGMAVNLMIHELSHVYHTENKHPSHDFQLLSDILSWLLHGKVIIASHEEVIHTIINHIQDVYADDIAFTIFAKNTKQEDLNAFFLDWIHEPIKTGRREERAWKNASFLLGAAFAQANLERHNIHDTDGKIAKAIEAFLAKSDKRLAAHYDFFKSFLVNLPRNITEREFEKLLITYTSEFLKLTKYS